MKTLVFGVSLRLNRQTKSDCFLLCKGLPLSCRFSHIFLPIVHNSIDSKSMVFITIRRNQILLSFTEFCLQKCYLGWYLVKTISINLAILCSSLDSSLYLFLLNYAQLVSRLSNLFPSPESHFHWLQFASQPC